MLRMMGKRRKKSIKPKNKILQVRNRQSNKKLLYQHGLEATGTLKFNHISGGTIEFPSIGFRAIPGNLTTNHWHFNSSMHSRYPDVIEVSFAVFYDDWCLFEKSVAGLELQNLLKETKKKDIQISQQVTTN